MPLDAILFFCGHLVVQVGREQVLGDMLALRITE
jgi:hypothetical protein